MRFLIEHHNRKKQRAELDEISKEVYDQYAQRLEKDVKDIETVTCSFYYNAKNWSKEKAFISTLHGRENKDAETDIKWATFVGMVDLIVKKYSAFLENNSRTRS